MRHAALLALLLAGCGGGGEEAPGNKAGAQATIPQPRPPADSFSSAPAEPEAREAAEAARTYFGHISARDYRAAWDMRWRTDPEGFDAFSEYYGAYARYEAQVGPPRAVLRGEGSLFVDVPVQLQGRNRDGESFVTAGMVTLRRSESEPDGRWRIYSGE